MKRSSQQKAAEAQLSSFENRDRRQRRELHRRKIAHGIFNHGIVFTIGLVLGLTHTSMMLSTPCVNVPADNAASFERAAHDRGNRVARVSSNAWRHVDVYIGDPSYLERPDEQSYSQDGQDILVRDLFCNKPRGYFVDLAANDATHLSNTYALERFGNWTGICIEANPRYWYRLAHRKCHVVGAAVGTVPNEEVMLDFEKGAWGGIMFDKEKRRRLLVANKAIAGAIGGRVITNAAPKVPWETTWKEARRTASLNDILFRNDAPAIIDYLSLDVEEAEYFIMSGFDFKHTFSVLSIEKPQEKLQDLLIQNGYKKMSLISWRGETLWMHKSFISQQSEGVDGSGCSSKGIYGAFERSGYTLIDVSKQSNHSDKLWIKKKDLQGKRKAHTDKWIQQY